MFVCFRTSHSRHRPIRVRGMLCFTFSYEARYVTRVSIFRAMLSAYPSALRRQTVSSSSDELSKNFKARITRLKYLGELYSPLEKVLAKRI